MAKRTIKKITSLPERTEGYSKHGCSGNRCKGKVEFLISYPWRDTTAERLYCRKHAERYAERYGLTI